MYTANDTLSGAGHSSYNAKDLPSASGNLPPPPTYPETPAAERIYPENKFGELGRADSFAPQSQTYAISPNTPVEAPRGRQPIPGHMTFEDAKESEARLENSEAGSDDTLINNVIPPTPGEDDAGNTVYVENQWGELSPAEPATPDILDKLSDKIIGTTEQLVGTITGNHVLHDKEPKSFTHAQRILARRDEKDKEPQSISFCPEQQIR